MILIRKCLDRAPHQHVHVLGHGVLRFGVLRDRHQLLSVLDPQHLQHLPVQLGQVVNLRRTLSQLQCRLVLHDPLSHRGCVRVRDGQDLHHVVVRLLGEAVPARRRVLVVRWHVVADDPLQEFELHPQAGVGARLHRAHGLELPLKDGQGGTYRSLGAHVADLQVRDGRKPASVLRDALQQRRKDLRRLLVRQGHDVVPDGA